MKDYNELIKALRVCKAGMDCACCPMHGEEEADDGVNCFCSAMRAADAIEELQMHVRVFSGAVDEAIKMMRSKEEK